MPKAIPVMLPVITDDIERIGVYEKTVLSINKNAARSCPMLWAKAPDIPIPT